MLTAIRRGFESRLANMFAGLRGFAGLQGFASRSYPFLCKNCLLTKQVSHSKICGLHDSARQSLKHMKDQCVLRSSGLFVVPAEASLSEITNALY